MTIAIIPARGGSKRIPRKNVRLFAGRPMIAHAITTARAAGIFDRIAVSTDDDEIRQVALAHGAEVPFVRPRELANDHATTDAVLVHALRWFESHGGLPRYACCIYATAPLLLPEDLRNGLELLQRADAATALAVTTFSYPILRALRLDPGGRLRMLWPEHRLTRSQDLPAAYHDAGVFYWMNVARYLPEGHLFGDNAVPVILPEHRVQDIDTEDDWAYAEARYRLQRELPTTPFQPTPS